MTTRRQTPYRKGDPIRILRECIGSTDEDVERLIPAGTIGNVLDVDIRDSGPLVHVEACGCWITYDKSDMNEIEFA